MLKGSQWLDQSVSNPPSSPITSSRYTSTINKYRVVPEVNSLSGRSRPDCNVEREHKNTVKNGEARNGIISQGHHGSQTFRWLVHPLTIVLQKVALQVVNSDISVHT